MLMSPAVDMAAPTPRRGCAATSTLKPRAAAFTLIEVLVVVAMIALLIVILLPALSRARDQVRSTACRSNMKQIAGGMLFYVTDHTVLPGTHSLFYFQSLFGGAWPRPPGVTWDGARDRLVNLTYTEAYTKPHHLDPEFIEHVPNKGTIFRYLKQEKVYTCPSDRPGPANDTPDGGGGNGRLSYSMNAYIGYRMPEQLQSFRYVANSLNNPLPGGQKTRSFTAGQRVVFPAAEFMLLFEEHPYYHMNNSFPEGNFNCIDRIATRHMPTGGSGAAAQGRTSIGFLDGHVESRLYPANTPGRELFTEFGQPHFWRSAGAPDITNMSAFIRRLRGPSPW
jgi:prepilin-type processing-associated H-X9-DG protein